MCGRRGKTHAPSSAKKPRQSLAKLYFDTIVFDREQLRHLVNLWGAGHIVAGTDYPYDMGWYDPRGFVEGVCLPQRRRQGEDPRPERGEAPQARAPAWLGRNPTPAAPPGCCQSRGAPAVRGGGGVVGERGDLPDPRSAPRGRAHAGTRAEGIPSTRQGGAMLQWVFMRAGRPTTRDPRPSLERA